MTVAIAPSVVAVRTGVPKGFGVRGSQQPRRQACSPLPPLPSPEFLIVGGDHVEQGDRWMGRLIYLFQEADVDTSVITWINADQVTDVIWSMDCWSTRH